MALSRAQKKLLAIRRAERRLQARLADIDWELDVLAAEVKELGQREATENAQVNRTPFELEAGDASDDLV